MNRAHTFPLRILKSSWGIAIDLRARAVTGAQPWTGALRVTDRVQLDVSRVRLPEVDIEQLARGLKAVAAEITAAHPDRHVLVEVDEVQYTPTDYQPEGMAAAMIGWANEEFGLATPDIEVRFDRAANRYVFALPATDSDPTD